MKYRIKAGCANHYSADGECYRAGDVVPDLTEDDIQQLGHKLEPVIEAAPIDEAATFDGPWTPNALAEFTLNQLRKIAGRLGVGTSGSKAELTERLLTAKAGG